MPKLKNPRKLFAVRIDPTVMKEMQHLSINLDRFTNELIEEAMKEFIERYKRGQK